MTESAETTTTTEHTANVIDLLTARAVRDNAVDATSAAALLIQDLDHLLAEGAPLEALADVYSALWPALEAAVSAEQSLSKR